MTRGRTALLAVVLVAGAAAMSASPALADPQPRRPDLKPLWKAFPLDQSKRPRARKGASRGAVQVRRAVPAKAGGSGRGSFQFLIAIAAAAILCTGIAVLVVRPGRARPVRVLGGRTSSGGQSVVSGKGGSRMANLRRKRRNVAAAHQSHEQPPSRDNDSKGAVERLSDYSLKGDARPADAADVDAPADRSVEEEPEQVDSELSPDLATVGEEVGTVLQSAHAAAERIRVAAHEEAERLRQETQAAAAAEIAKAHRAAEVERAEANRERTEADRYTEETRAAADALAEQQRADAERDAAGILKDAQNRLAAANAEVELQARTAHANLRKRAELLQGEIKRYEERLNSMLTVFDAMRAQLEELLGKQRVEKVEPERAKEGLEEALKPVAPSSRGE
jgi:hypothetical protein